MKVGIIGTGGIAKAHANAISSLDLVNFTGAWDVDAKKLNAFCDIYGATAFADLHDLLDNVDGVIIASPNFAHCEQAIMALDNMKYVLCEKPMAITLNEASAMANHKNIGKVAAAVSHNYRYLPVVSELTRLLASGDLGEIISVNISLKKNSALSKKTFSWRDDSLSNLTSGALGDLGVHMFDLAWFLFKSPFVDDKFKVDVKKLISSRESKNILVDDYARVYGLLENGIFTKFTLSKSSPLDDLGFIIEVIGNKREFYYSSVYKDFYILKTGNDKQEIQMEGAQKIADPHKEVFGWSDSFTAQINDWYKLYCGIKSEEVLIADFVDGHRVQHALNEMLKLVNRSEIESDHTDDLKVA